MGSIEEHPLGLREKNRKIGRHEIEKLRRNEKKKRRENMALALIKLEKRKYV